MPTSGTKIMNDRITIEELNQLSLEVLEQLNKEWEMMMDHEFPNWRELRDPILGGKNDWQTIAERAENSI